MVDILQVAASGAKKSHIMLKANLNSVKAGQLIQHLVSKGILRSELLDGEGPMYQTTEKGLTLINLFHQVESLLKGTTGFLDEAVWQRPTSPLTTRPPIIT